MELDYEYEVETGYWTSRNTVPKYRILETEEDSITGTVWHKLKTNEKAAQLIHNCKAHTQWDYRTELSGKIFVWATDQLLTILHLQGLQQGL